MKSHLRPLIVHLLLCSAIIVGGWEAALGQFPIPGVRVSLVGVSDAPGWPPSSSDDELLQPSGEGLWFKVVSGEMFLFSRADGGGYYGECSGRDDICQWVKSASSCTKTILDRDFFPIFPLRPDTCICAEEDRSLSSSLVLNLSENLAQFTFTSSAVGYCWEDPANNCPPLAPKLTNHAYNQMSLAVEDRSKVYQGRVRVYGRLIASGIELDDDGCDAVDSYITQRVSARYNKPPSQVSQEVPCYLSTAMDVQRFDPTTIDPLFHEETVKEGEWVEGETLGWYLLTPSSGICLGESFSLGFEFYFECYGDWPYAPNLTLQLGVQAVPQSTCP